MKNLKKYFFIAPLFLSVLLLGAQKVTAEDVADVGQEATVKENVTATEELTITEKMTEDRPEESLPVEDVKETESKTETNEEKKSGTENSGLVSDIIDFVQDTFGGDEPSPEENLENPTEEKIPAEEIPVMEEDLTLLEELKIEVLNIMEEITDFFTVDTREEVVIEPRREVEIEKENIDYTNTSDSCKADPFLVDISNGMKTTTIYTIDTKSRETTRKIQIGDLPQGVDVRFGSNNSYSKNVKDGETKFILEIKKEEGDQKGSFNIPIIYTVGESKVICQISVSNT